MMVQCFFLRNFLLSLGRPIVMSQRARLRKKLESYCSHSSFLLLFEVSFHDSHSRNLAWQQAERMRSPGSADCNTLGNTALFWQLAESQPRTETTTLGFFSNRGLRKKTFLNHICGNKTCSVLHAWKKCCGIS